jgi:hypothetical protein
MSGPFQGLLPTSAGAQQGFARLAACRLNQKGFAPLAPCRLNRTMAAGRGL